jgi:hypothetical protein
MLTLVPPTVAEAVPILNSIEMIGDIRHFVGLVFATCLVTANIIVLLPDKWTFFQFCPTPISISNVRLYPEGSGPKFLVIECVPPMPGFPSILPVPMLQRALEKRRVDQFVQHALITVLVQQGSGAPTVRRFDSQIGWWRNVPSGTALEFSFHAKSCWAPTPRLPMRFLVPLTISDGEYHVCVLIRNADWSWTQNRYKDLQNPQWPGTVIVNETFSNTISVVSGHK